MHAANFRSPYGRNSRGHCFRVEVAARAPFERARGNAAPVGTAFATVAATFTDFLNEVPGLEDRFEPRGEQLRGRCQWAGASSSLDSSTVDLRCGRLILTGLANLVSTD
jgi:hypothetical protein